MARYRAETFILAPPERVWQVLVDLPRYPEWNPFTVSVASSLDQGAPVDMQVRLHGQLRHQREQVSIVEPPHCLGWGMQLGPRWWLRAERRQTLGAVEGGTRYVTDDHIQGVLSPIVHWIFGTTLERGFAEMTQALKRRVEG